MIDVTVRFVSHPGLFTKLCRFAQNGFWATHCEAIMPDKRRLSAWFLKGGVRILPADYDAGEFDREQFVTLSLTGPQASAFFNFLYDQVGKPYDWRSIVAFYAQWFRPSWQEDDAWFCDELLAGALVAAGVFPQKMASERNRITVFDFYLVSGMLAKGE